MTKIATPAFIALMLCACSGGPSVKPETPAGVNLAGTWQLNRQASQDPQALLETMRQKLTQRMGPHHQETMADVVDDEIGTGADDEGGSTRSPRGAGRRGGGMGGAGASSSGGEHAGLRGRRVFNPQAGYARALGAALKADSVTIEQSATRMLIAHGDSRRSFTPGADSVISVAEGVADQRSGWQGKEYVVDVRPQVGPHVIERYGLSADGRQLVEKFTLTDEGLPKLEFTRVYDSGKLVPRSLPTSN